MTEFRPSRFQILPVIVKNLIIINSLMVLAQFVLGRFGIDLADYLGLHYWKSEHFGFWQFFTHMFLHGSYDNVNLTIMHLFSNMFALWMFGSILENIWGPKRFLTFYLICGLGAAMLHLGVLGYEFAGLERIYQANPNPNDYFRLYGYEHPVYKTHIDGYFDQATVGASGAVFGILFAFGYLFPNTLLYIYFLVPIKAKYVVAAYALFELFAGFQNSAGDQVAHFAHLGGMLVAFIILRIWGRTNRTHFY